MNPDRFHLPDSPADQLEQFTQLVEQLAQSEAAAQMLRALIETMPVGAVISSASGETLIANQAARKILGSDVKGSLSAPKRLYQTYFSDGRPLLPDQTPLSQAIQTGNKVADMEILIRHSAGKKINLLTSAVPVRNTSGEIVSGIVVFTDITERKRAQQALHRYAEMFELLHQVDQSILRGEALESSLELVLPFLEELVGYQQAGIFSFEAESNQAVLLAFQDHGQIDLPPDTRIPIDPNWPLAELAQGDFYPIADLSIFETQPVIYQALQAAAVKSLLLVPLIAQEQLLGSIVFYCSETPQLTSEVQQLVRQVAVSLAIGMHQRRMQRMLQDHTSELETRVARRSKALRASEARFRSIFQESVLGIALLDRNGRILTSNPSLQRMLQYSETELQNMRLMDISHPEQVTVERDLYLSLLAGDLDQYQYEKRYIRKDGTTRWLRLLVSRIRGSLRNEPGVALIMAEDFSQQKQDQEMLFQTERLAIAGRLVASLAHEINNPLQSALGCVGLAAEMLVEQPQAVHYLEIAMEEMERTARIITQLRNLSRSSEKAEQQVVDLNALVDKTLILVRKRCQSQDIEVSWKPQPDLPAVMLVRDQIQQVLLNLVLNAIDAMPGGGQLALATNRTRSPAGIEISISDNGVGIEPTWQARLFEPFQSSRSDGLGLGLYISKRIVDEHEGTIQFQSQIGEGTTFTVWLPFEVGSGEKQP